MQIRSDRDDARSRRPRLRPTLALSLIGALVLGGLGLVTSPATSAVRPATAKTASSTSPAAVLVAARARPRALFNYVAVRDARGRLVVSMSSNAKKVTVSYRSGKTRSKTVKLRGGAAQVTVPAGATKVKARAKSTKKLRASKWVKVVATVDTTKPSPSPPTPVPPTPTPPTPTTPPPPRGGTKVLGLPPIGPAAPDAPPAYRWYEALQTLDCTGFSEMGALPDGMTQGQWAMYLSLAQVCLNLTGQGNGAVDWAAAASALNQTPAENNCLVVAARSVLSAAVAAHEADPTATLTAGSPAPGTACPVAITDAFVDSPGTQYTLQIFGPYLFGLTGVAVNGVALDVPDDPNRDFESDPPVVTIFASGSTCLRAGQPATVTVTGRGYQVPHTFTPTSTVGACSP